MVWRIGRFGSVSDQTGINTGLQKSRTISFLVDIGKLLSVRIEDIL
jgi:hypothetical protein